MGHATLFISDLHLHATRPRMIELFLWFLHEQAARAEALYILGDLYEAWIGDDLTEPDSDPVIAGLRALTDSGVHAAFLPGNRDFLAGARFAALTGCRLLEDPTRIDLYGCGTLLMHGDTLCTGDVEYQKFRKLVHDPAWQRQFLALSREERLRLAAQARAESKAHTGTQSEEIMDVEPDAVVEALERYGVEQLIHGHTHRPALHHLQVRGRPARRFVLGDWYESGSVLRCDADGCALQALEPLRLGTPPSSQ